MRLTDRQWFWIGILTSSALLLKQLLVPLNPDNDTYQAMAWQLYKYGRLPYLGSFDQNFPGIVYIHWLAIAVFGNTALSFRILDVVFHIASCALLFSVCRRWLPAKTSAIASILFALYYTHDSYWLVGQRDGFAVTFILLALWLYLRDKQNGRLLLAGLALGCATLIRPTFGLFLFAIPLLDTRHIRLLLKRVGLMSLGLAMPWIVQLIPYALTPDGLKEYYLITVRFTLDLYGKYALSWSNLLLWNRAQKIYFTILFIWIVLAFVKTDKGMDRQRVRVFVILFIASLLPVIIMRKFSIYHYDPLFTLLTPVCAITLVKLSDLFREQYRAIALGVFMLIMAFRLFPRHVVKDFIRADIRTSGSRLAYVYDRIDSDSLCGEAAERELSGFVRTHTSPEQSIVFASIWPGASWRSERREATRFTTWYALGMTDRDGHHTIYQQEWQREYVNAIAMKKPAIVIVAKAPHSFLLDRGDEPDQKFFSLPGMKEAMSTNYTYDTTIRAYDIYKLRQGS